MKNYITRKKQVPKYLKVEEVSSLLNMKVSHIMHLVFKDQIPHLKVGASVHFIKEDLKGWINSKLVEERG